MKVDRNILSGTPWQSPEMAVPGPPDRRGFPFPKMAIRGPLIPERGIYKIRSEVMLLFESNNPSTLSLPHHLHRQTMTFEVGE